jgi:superfamily II DNA or RNA helicase
MRLIFDRGTLLLMEPPPELSSCELPGVVWDSRVGAHRASASRYAVLCEELSRRGVRFSDSVRPAGQPARFSALTLRPYQEAALQAWEQAGHRGLIVLPTGSGKTRLALAAIARSGQPALCLVPTRALLAQWQRALADVYDGPIGCYGDGVHEIQAVTVATFESAYRHMAHLGHRFGLLLVDEAHHFGRGLRDEALDMCAAPLRMGLTATPPRDEAGQARLGELIGPPCYALSIGDLSGSYLAPCEQVLLPLPLSADEAVRYEALMADFAPVYDRFRAASPGAPWAEFVRACAPTAAGRRALAAFREANRLLAYTGAKRTMLSVLLRRHRDARVLVFCANNETAYAIAREHLIMPVTCDISRWEREEVLQRFSSGALRALCSARVLNEGLDVPDADVAIVVGGALGEREHVQRVGRLLRPAPGKHAVCYELAARGTIEMGQSRRRRAGLAARTAAPL